MKLSFDEEKSLLKTMLEGLDASDDNERAKGNKADFLLERIINVANFASKMEDHTARLTGKAYVNGIYLRGESNTFLVVDLALKSGRKKVTIDGKIQERDHYENYSCFVYKPRLKQWLSSVAQQGGNPFEKLLIGVSLVNPTTEAELYEGKPIISRTAILDGFEIQ